MKAANGIGMGKDVLTAFPIALVCAREINVKGSFRYIHGCYKGISSLIIADSQMRRICWNVDLWMQRNSLPTALSSTKPRKHSTHFSSKTPEQSKLSLAA